MPEPVQHLLSLVLPCDVQAPAHVRTALAEIHQDGWSLADGQLVASELVTNAVKHSGCRPEDRLLVDVRLLSDGIEISVQDPGLSKRTANPRPPGDFEPGGWGLQIVERLSRRWGTARPDGYRVWAELPRR
jgi:anti-sigma regulatory factor (Ser/Thr protein kinase)